MKKLLLGMTGLILSFTLVLVGCSDDNTTDLNLGSIGNPDRLEATVIPGAVILTWDPVKDATGYRVVRRDNQTNGANAYVLGTTTAQATFFADVRSFNNQLEDGIEYRYTVYSIPDTAKDVLEGQSSRNARAVVPPRTAPASTWDNIAITNFATERQMINVGGTMSERLVVRFDEVPAFQYTIRYNYGTGTIIQNLTSDQTTVSTIENTGRHRVVHFPLIAGTNTITVEARFGNSTTTAGTYYTEVISRSETENLNRTLLNTPNVSGNRTQVVNAVTGMNQWTNTVALSVTRTVGVTGTEIWIQQVTDSTAGEAYRTYGAWTQAAASWAQVGTSTTFTADVAIPMDTATSTHRVIAINTGADGTRSLAQVVVDVGNTTAITNFGSYN